MYKCQACRQVIAKGIPQMKAVVGTRLIEYMNRKGVKLTRTEIAEEKKLCPECYDKFQKVK